MAFVIILYFTIAVVGGLFLFKYLFKTEMGLEVDSKVDMTSDKKKAIADLNKKLSNNPKDTNALFSLAEIYFDHREYTKALPYYKILHTLLLEKDINVSPYVIYLHYGISCAELHMYDDASELLVMAHAIESSSFEVNYYLGVCAYYKGQYEDAFKYLKVASLSQPEDMNSLKYLGYIFFQAQNYKNALMCLNRVQQSTYKTPESTYYFGYALLKIGKREEAFAVLSGLSTNLEWGGLALKECSDISFKMGNYQKAIDLGLEAIRTPSFNLSDKDKASIHYILGNSYVQLRDIPSALDHLKKVRVLSSDYADIPEKIEYLQEIYYNKNLQAFLTANWTEFESMALKIIRIIFPKAKIASHQKMKSSLGETVDILAEIETRQWEDVVLVRFIRDKNQVGEIFIRDLAARLKEYKAGRGICITAGSFSVGAKMFVEARLIDLVDKNKLISYLQKIK